MPSQTWRQFYRSARKTIHSSLRGQGFIKDSLTNHQVTKSQIPFPFFSFPAASSPPLFYAIKDKKKKRNLEGPWVYFKVQQKPIIVSPSVKYFWVGIPNLCTFIYKLYTCNPLKQCLNISQVQCLLFWNKKSTSVANILVIFSCMLFKVQKSPATCEITAQNSHQSKPSEMTSDHN